ncbi:MAG: hypothetical protein IPM50_13850 [Acidobacteriota bacterium]|nr:MAG: hypothetical protein IPM50_13850 [Acidobacteriota bacterium]
MSDMLSGRSFGEMLIDRACSAAMECIREGENLFEREWGVVVFRRDPKTGKYRSEVYCCDEAAA